MHMLLLTELVEGKDTNNIITIPTGLRLQRGLGIRRNPVGVESASHAAPG
jgi:hypothetical protein